LAGAAAAELLLKEPPMKRLAIVWLIESLFGSERKRPDWSMVIFVAGIAIIVVMIIMRFAR
jgi:hypothetical protein